MRKIKFRMWDPDKKVFTDCIDPFTFDIKITLESIEDSLISQFTGLLDKNGKEVYEGDIVKGVYWGNFGESEDVIFEVSFFEGMFCYRKESYTIDGVQKYSLISLSEFNWEYGFKEPWCHLEVMGNIYENPEVLEQTV